MYMDQDWKGGDADGQWKWPHRRALHVQTDFDEIVSDGKGDIYN